MAEKFKKTMQAVATPAEEEVENPKITKVMKEFKNGTLKSSSGKLVTDIAQAKAIALSETNLSKEKGGYKK